MKKRKEVKELVCPYCQHAVAEKDTRLAQLQSFIRPDYNIIDLAKSGKFKTWTCLKCEKNGFSIYPEHDKQNFGMGGPILMYINRHLVCSECHEDYVFTASEQKFWYETLHFNYSSFPKSCPACRKKDRAARVRNTKLSELMKQEEKNADTLQKIADLYEEMGLMEKSKEYTARAKKKRGKEK